MPELTSITVAPLPAEVRSELSELQIRALSLRLLMGDASQAEVARVLGVTPEAISNWKRQPAFARAWADVGVATENIINIQRKTGIIRSYDTLIAAQSDESATIHDKIDAATKFLTLEQRRKEHEAEPARMAWAAQLELWKRRSVEILEGDVGPAGGTGAVGEGEANGDGDAEWNE